MGGLQLNEYPEDERHQQSMRLRVPLAGLVVALSLLAGAVAGILAYRYAENRSKPRAVTSAPAAPAEPIAPTSVPSEKPASTEPPAAQEKPGKREKPAVSKQTAVLKVEPKLVDDHLQLTITLDQMVRYEAHRLENPDRIYIDLHGAHITPEVGRNIAVKQGGVADIRLGKIPPNTVRVVLDLDQRFDYSVTQQENPAALVLKLTPHNAT